MQKLLREKGGAKGLLQEAEARPPRAPEAASQGADEVAREEIEAVLGELQDIRRMLASNDG